MMSEMEMKYSGNFGEQLLRENYSPTKAGAVPHHGESTTMLAVQERIIELEYENTRLQRLVSELLVKNQKLRESL